ncbi:MULTISPECIES: globin [Pseudoalteromonas]|uniref:globin n=1 Tax=Pseudoalteromonas TaxID=53246 RepID=UPI00030F8424|nr:MULTISPECIES: globin [Pseudoalteromonas]MCF6143474.1 hypothetical protein [Pseudoalteromonas mariniglutinosa NCIMB 1770]TMN72727.1 globin [Pseudoalteromonas sp. S1727]
MCISNDQQKLLLQNIAIIKPNFHCFTVTFQVQLKRQALTIKCPSSNAISEKSYILYCALERTLSHLDNLSMVTPFIEHHANNLAKLGISNTDVNLLCDAFYNTLQIHLGNHFTHKAQIAWSYSLRLFKNIVKSYLFNFSNVVAINTQIHKSHRVLEKK